MNSTRSIHSGSTDSVAPQMSVSPCDERRMQPIHASQLAAQRECFLAVRIVNALQLSTAAHHCRLTTHTHQGAHHVCCPGPTSDTPMAYSFFLSFCPGPTSHSSCRQQGAAPWRS